VLPSGKLRLPKVGDVPVRWSRPLPSEPSSVTVVKDAAGRYFASFVIETDPVADAARFPEAGVEGGIDLGLASFAVLSDGTVVTAPKFLRRAERKLRRLQREYCRKVNGSANQEKARVKVARAHARTAGSRRDFHHKLSTRIIRDNQAVYVEDLCVAGLARTRLAKSIHDAGWASFTSMLAYKAKRYGRHFGRHPRFQRSTGMCPRTGELFKLTLSDRWWDCPCGDRHDRDLAAAQVILAAGRAERLNARGGGVRPGPAPAAASEAGTLPKSQPGSGVTGGNPRPLGRSGSQSERTAAARPSARRGA
jgi:putative transposase